MIALQAAVAALATAVGAPVDPAEVATAVVAGLEAAGLTADEIAGHVLAGLAPGLAADVVAAMGAKLAAP